MWHTVAGHGPDHAKIKPLHFICLSIIAASGSQGIYQHDLVKTSGQDKRSLPARTDDLHASGYIEKKPVCIQLHSPKRLLKTSQLTLRRYVDLLETPLRGENDGTTDEGSGFAGTSDTAQKTLQVGEGTNAEEQDICTDLPVPQWTPDRSLSNQMFDLIDRSGIEGMTMKVCLC